MKKSLFLVLFLGLSAVMFSQNINGRLSSSFYTFERYDSQNSSDTYVRTFQTLRLNATKSQYSLVSSLNFATDIGNSLDNDPRLRFYNLYLTGRNLFDIATIKIGRQPVFNSVASGIMDGASLKLNYNGFVLNSYYGGNVPAYQKLEITDDWENDYILGGELEFRGVENMYVSVGYVDKNFKAYDYVATRLDEDLNPIQILIRNNSNQYNFATASAGYKMDNLFRVDTKFEYDINLEDMSLFEISGRYEQIENLGIDLYYNIREPKVRYNSIFSVFNYGNSQEIEAGVDYKFSRAFTTFAKFGYVKYEDDNSSRLTAGFHSSYGSLSYRKTFGYAGELDAISASAARTFFKGMLTPSVGVSYTTYKLSEEDEAEDILTLLAGVNYRPWSVLSFDLQAQQLHNKILDNDFRVLFKINYWFNTNLNVL